MKSNPGRSLALVLAGSLLGLLASTSTFAQSTPAQGLLTNRYLDGVPEDSRVRRGNYFGEEMLSQENLARVFLRSHPIAFFSAMGFPWLRWKQAKSATFTTLPNCPPRQLNPPSPSASCRPL